MRRKPLRALAVALVALALAAAACSGGDDDDGNSGGASTEDPGDCVPVDMAVSSEKIALLSDLADQFNDSDASDLGDGDCAFVRIEVKASGAATRLLTDGWPDPAVSGPQPVVWSPAASSWAAILNQRLSDQGEPEMATDAEPFMLTPLVIAMPEPMAEALGYPETPIGYADILRLANDPAGWGAFGHPEWGPFRLGKTNPNFSTSALSATIAQYYAATGKTADLSLEDLNRPEVQQFARGVESSVVHYGDITQTFLNNWFRNDVRGTALTYASAVAVEEKSVIDYNKGNPDGVLSPGEEAREPRIPLVAIYPKEGTLYSDNPFIVLDAPWVTDQEREGARAFEEYVKRPEVQRRVLEGGFRPGNPDVPIGEPISAKWRVDANQPQTLLEVPAPEVLTALLDRWAQDRKRGRVTLLVDVSGSMGDPADPEAGATPTKLDLAKTAVVEALDEFAPDDDVGLRMFTTGLGPNQDEEWMDLVPIGPLAGQRESIARSVDDLFPLEGTPLYTATEDTYDDMIDAFDPARINAVVLLSDGRNEDPQNDDLEGLLRHLRAGSEGATSQPVRVFAIAYGGDADFESLRRIAEATNAQVYDASDATTISQVFTAVVSNF
jgi:Ca-activated chloride channel homolog